MRLRRLCVIAILGLIVFSGSVFAANVEDALTPCPENSVYAVLKLNDTGKFLKWVFSSENIETFMPLILTQEDSNEIIGAIEMISMFAENTPLKSLAFVGGVQSSNTSEPFFQVALTVNEGSTSIVKRIENGTATAVDIAKLLLGNDSPLAPLAVSIIKVEKASDNILRIDNEVFVKAYDGLVLVALSEDGIKVAMNALNNSDKRMFEAKPRKFNSQDFALLHFDSKTAKLLDDDNEEFEDLEKYFDKPFELEFDFERVPDKFTIMTALNLLDSLKKEYADKLAKKIETIPAVKGGYMSLVGEKSPVLAFGGVIDVAAVRDDPELLPFWKIATNQMKNRFGITEKDLVNFFDGPLSVNVNDSVVFEGFSVPAIYISQTGKNGAAANIYNTIAKSRHFHKVQEGVLQIDSSLSPIACLVQNKGETLGINFAELANISKTPELAPSLQNLMNRKAVSSIWIDFAGIQNWIRESGVLLMLEPLAKFTGYGEVFDAVKDIINSKFSVPSLSICCESIEIFRTEFNITEVDAKDGFMSKVIKIARKYITTDKKSD